MAIIKKGILGGFSNKVGNVVGSSWKGISTMRSLPESYNDANSEAQQQQRNWFRFYSEAGSQLLTSFIRPVLDPQAKRMSGYNLFVQQNLRAISRGELNPEQNVPIFSQGRLCPVEIYYINHREDTSVVNYAIKSKLNCAQGEVSDDVYLIGMYDDHQIAWAGKVGTRGVDAGAGDGTFMLEGKIDCPQFEEAVPEYWVAVAFSKRLKESSEQSLVHQTNQTA